MVQVRKIKVANPHRGGKPKSRKAKASAARSHQSARRRKKTAKPAHRKRKLTAAKTQNPGPVLVTLGAINPQKGANMAKSKKYRAGGKKSGAKRNGSVKLHKPKGRSGSTRIYVRNSAFGGNGTGTKVLGILAGVTATKLITPMVPSALTANPFMRILAAIGVAWAAGRAAAKMAGPEAGTYVTYGGYAQAASLAINAFVPSLGGQLGLSGRGMGAFAPANTALPYNPISQQVSVPQNAGAAVSAAAGGMGVYAFPRA